MNLDAGFRRHGGLSLRLNASSTGPCFSLILTAIFLRDVGCVAFRIVVSAGMVVGGVLLISWWK
jgi:hypothetical protein